MKLTVLKELPWFIKNYFEINKQLKLNDEFKIGKIFPVLQDKNNLSGIISGFYFYQDLLMSQKIFKNNPKKHVDIGSRIDGFVAQVASYREIEIFDIRPLESKIKNIIYRTANLMDLPEGLINYTDSISSLSVIEHFGLGRYGDPIDVNGHIKGLDNIYQILKKGGKFYFSVPFGPQRIEFNAHRVFSLDYLLKLFEGKYKVDSFSYVNDNGDLIENATLNKNDIISNFGCTFGNGLFELTKN